MSVSRSLMSVVVVMYFVILGGMVMSFVFMVVAVMMAGHVLTRAQQEQCYGS